ncbi:MAG: hypothetical protein J0M24_03950 [Verrucomicrobia bacterium]|nr:hypothetical protein [Verrucomicrobiota bacterium]
MVTSSSARWSLLAALLTSGSVQGLDLNNHVISGGGGSGRTSRFVLDGTIGQAAAESAAVEGGDASLRSGYWPQVVRWLNSAPIAREDVLERRAGQGVHVLASVLLQNDSATDLEPLRWVQVEVTSAGGGTVFREGPFLIYEPLASAPPEAEDSFEYVVSDALGVTARGTVRIRLAGSAPGGPPNALEVETVAGGTPTVRVRFHGVAGRTYEVQFATEVSGQWTSLGRLAAGTDGNLFWEEPLSTGPRFYRIVEPNP